jgi:DNA-binding CsgD family transcriptional regulator/PAS domain-containing protein
MDEQRLSSITGDIYDAALDPTLWSHVLEEAAGFVGGAASALFMKDAIRKTHNTAHAWGYDPDFTRIYVDKYSRFDPFTTAQFFSEVGCPISGADIISHREHRKTRFFKEWVQPQHWIDAIAATLERSATTYSAFSVIRHEDDGVVDDRARRRMKLIVPHVRRAVLIGRIIDLHKLENAAFADTLDGLATAIFFADADRRIVHANEAGRAMLAEAAVVRGSAGKLVACDAIADHALHDIFINAESGDAAVGTTGIAVQLYSREGESHVAHVLPLTSGARRKAGIAYSAVAALFVRKAALDPPHSLETIACTFKLTPAEMRVLMMIVEIGGIPEIASMLGVSEATVKTHLQHIFDKTTTNRQVDLVKLVAGYVSPFVTSPPA